MPFRPDRDDLTPQRERLTAARAGLAGALADLAKEARAAERPLHSKANEPPPVDLRPVHAAMVRVRLAEQDVDIAIIDLATASGVDLWEVG